jgi:hypothetical protein
MVKGLSVIPPVSDTTSLFNFAAENEPRVETVTFTAENVV